MNGSTVGERRGTNREGGGVKARGGRGCRLARKLILFPHVNSVCGGRGLVWFVNIY